MRTVTYKSVEEKANLLFAGKVRPTTDDAAALNRFINARYREMFEQFFWPEWTVIERRTFRQAYAGTTSYSPTAEVYYWPPQSYYQVLRNPLLTLTTLTRAGTTATATYAAGHSLTVADNPRITISGATPAGFNGTWTGTVASATTVTYTMPADPGANATGTLLMSIHPTDASDITTEAYWAESLGSYSADDWNATAAYAVGNQVYQPLDGYYYQCITAHSNQSPPNATYWGRLTPFVRDIDFVEGNQGASATDIGEVKKPWDANPREVMNARPQDFDITSDGIVVRGSANVVWLEFRHRPNEFTGDTWASGGPYAVGTQVYYTTTGEYYRCIASATTEAPTDTAKWEKLDFPYVLKDAVAQAAYADMLKMSGKTSKYAAELMEARRILHREFDKLERQQGQAGNLNVMTR